jgi:hypothetical protein
MFKRYLNYELQNIENEVRNRFSLAEFVGETLYSGNYVNGSHFENALLHIPRDHSSEVSLLSDNKSMGTVAILKEMFLF